MPLSQKCAYEPSGRSLAGTLFDFALRSPQALLFSSHFSTLTRYFWPNRFTRAVRPRLFIHSLAYLFAQLASSMVLSVFRRVLSHSATSAQILHGGLVMPEIGTSALDLLLVHLLDCSHRSLVCLLRTARFARALRCTHSFARSLTHSLTPKFLVCPTSGLL